MIGAIFAQHIGNSHLCVGLCRYIYAVYAKTLGVPIVSACTTTADTGWEMLSNCVHRLVDYDRLGGDDCTATGKCLTASAATCCSTIAEITSDLECTTGYKCTIPGCRHGFPLRVLTVVVVCRYTDTCTE